MNKIVLFLAAAAVCAFTSTNAQDENAGYSGVSPHHAVADKPKDKANLRCSTVGSQFENAQLTWERNEDTIHNTDGKYRLKPENNTLEVQNIDYIADLGEYECVFTFQTSADSQRTTVYLYAKSYVNDFDKSKNYVQGDKLKLECDAYGHPTPSARWLKDDEAIVPDERTSFADYNGVTNGTLMIANMDYADAGDYSCVSENDYGTHNRTIIIRVKDKYAALWPFLGICAEVIVLCTIIFIYEKRRAKKMAEEDAKEEADHLTNSHANRDDVRQRKV